MTILANLTGKTGPIVGIANRDSLASGCALVLRAAGADLALTCRKERETVAKEPREEAFATTWPTWRGLRSGPNS